MALASTQELQTAAPRVLIGPPGSSGRSGSGSGSGGCSGTGNLETWEFIDDRRCQVASLRTLFGDSADKIQGYGLHQNF